MSRTIGSRAPARIVAAFGIATLALGCSSMKPAASSSGARGAPGEEASPSDIVPPGWKRTDAEDAGFAVLLPQGAVEKHEVVEGGSADIWVGKDRGSAYLVMMHAAASTKDPPEKVLRDEAVGFILGCKGAPKEASLIAESDHPKLRAIGTCKEAKPVLVEVHLSAGRIYTLVVVIGSDETRDADIDRFFGSFRLAKH